MSKYIIIIFLALTNIAFSDILDYQTSGIEIVNFGETRTIGYDVIGTYINDARLIVKEGGRLIINSNARISFTDSSKFEIYGDVVIEGTARVYMSNKSETNLYNSNSSIILTENSSFFLKGNSVFSVKNLESRVSFIGKARLYREDSSNYFRFPVKNNVRPSVRTSKFSLLSAQPNPFNPTTNINFSVSEATNLSLDIINVKGQFIKSIFTGKLEAGKHQMKFNAQNFNSGMYFYRIKTKNELLLKKLLLVK